MHASNWLNTLLFKYFQMYALWSVCLFLARHIIGKVDKICVYKKAKTIEISGRVILFLLCTYSIIVVGLFKDG